MLLIIGLVLVASAGAIKHFTYEIIETQPHSTSYFTQGLMFRLPDNNMLEGTGLPGQSLLISYAGSNARSPTGVVLKRGLPIDDAFGEGIAQFHREVFQLTWQNNKVFVWNSETLELNRTMNLPHEMKEGWGLCTSPAHDFLLASEGSGKLFWINATDVSKLEVEREVVVRDCHQQKLVIGINELETVPLRLTHPEEALRPAPTVPRGEHDLENFAQSHLTSSPPVASSPALVWGNIFGTLCIAVIDPLTGEVRAYIHLDGLSGNHARADVLNGIAFRDDGSDTVWVTGKKWDKLYRIAIKPTLNNGATAPAGFPKKCQATFFTHPKQRYTSGSTECKKSDFVATREGL